MKIQLRALALPFGLAKPADKSEASAQSCPDGKCPSLTSTPDLLTRIREKQHELDILKKQYVEQNPFLFNPLQNMIAAFNSPFAKPNLAHTQAWGYRKVFVSPELNGGKPFFHEDFWKVPSDTSKKTAQS